MTAYEPALASQAWEWLCSLSKTRQKRIIRIIRQLASSPFVEGDYNTTDSTGRPLENLRIEDFIITFWADHHAKEIRVLDITEL